MDVVKRVNRELNQEMRKQVDLIYSAAAIAFARYWDKGWGPERIRELALSIERRAGIAPDADGPKHCSRLPGYNILQILK